MIDGIKNFTNTDEEDFEGMYGGEKIIIRRGQTKAFTERIAKHLAGQLVHKILTRQKKDYLLDPGRQGLINSMLGSVVAPPPEPVRVEAPAPAVAEKEEEFPEVKQEEEVKEEVKPKKAPVKRRRTK